MRDLPVGQFLAVLALGYGVASRAAGQGVSGQVRDSVTREALSNATVSLVNGEMRSVAISTTLANGAFLLSAPAGTYQLMIRRVGYLPKSEAIVLSAGAVLSRSIVMAPNPTLLAPIETRAQNGGLTSGAEFVRRHVALGKGIIVSGFEIRQSGLPTTEYLASFEGITLTPVAPPGIPVVPGANGRFLSSTFGNCLYARIDRSSIAYRLIDRSVEDIDALLKPEDIMAVELFRNTSELPPEWKSEASISTIIERLNGGAAYWMGHSERPPITEDMRASDSLMYKTTVVFSQADVGRMPVRRTARNYDPSKRPRARTLQSAPICGFMQIWTKIAW